AYQSRLGDGWHQDGDVFPSVHEPGEADHRPGDAPTEVSAERDRHVRPRRGAHRVGHRRSACAVPPTAVPTRSPRETWARTRAVPPSSRQTMASCPSHATTAAVLESSAHIVETAWPNSAMSSPPRGPSGGEPHRTHQPYSPKSYEPPRTTVCSAVPSSPTALIDSSGPIRTRGCIGSASRPTLTVRSRDALATMVESRTATALTRLPCSHSTRWPARSPTAT